MFETSREISEAVDALYELTMTLDRGDILMHTQIVEVLGLMPHQGRWGHIVGKVRRRLLDGRGIATWFVKGVGYELLTKARQLELPTWRTKKAIRQFRKSRVSIQRLPEGELSLHQRRFRSMMLERLGEAERAARHELREQSQILRPIPVLPRRALPEAVRQESTP